MRKKFVSNKSVTMPKKLKGEYLVSPSTVCYVKVRVDLGKLVFCDSLSVALRS